MAVLMSEFETVWFTDVKCFLFTFSLIIGW